MTSSTTESDGTETEIIQGDCINEMQAMDADSVHAVVTDPPYGLAFMPGVNDWDEFDSPKDYQDFCEEWATECRRVLKPGGHLIAFSGNRTYGRLMCGVQDAGFEIRDTLTWHQGEGFPKASTVSQWMDGEDAERWDGFKSSLKPATEFAVLARAPMSEDAIYKNVLKHGTGALNVDRTRIPTEEGGRPSRDPTVMTGSENWGGGTVSGGSKADGTTTEGRYPSNLLLDPIAAAMLDEQSGGCPTGTTGGNSKSTFNKQDPTAFAHTVETDGFDDDATGASRFFKTVEPTRFKYTSKACKSERTINGEIENNHSTVKPLDLMEWLVTLVTAPGQRVLDPFAGSGTTIMACRRLDREGIGIEMDEDHAELARERVALADEVDTDFLDTQPTADGTDATEDTDTDDGSATLESFGDD